MSNLLESAGFSKSNPYYIVQQGKITTLALMKDPERLELLMEVAGCKVYDERREESERIMVDTEQRREKVVEVVEYIEERLDELGGEKEELKEWSGLDRDKRALEYTIYDQELKSARSALQKLDDERADLAENLKEAYSQRSESEDNVKELEDKIEAARLDDERQKTEKKTLAADLREVTKKKAKLELDIEEGRALQKSNADRKETLEHELEETRAELSKTESQLKKVAPKFEAQLGKENELKEEMDDVERRTKELNNKQGRAADFSSKQDRDKYLKKEIAALNVTLKEQQGQEKKLDKEISKMTKESGGIQGGMDKALSDLDQLKTQIEQGQKDHHDLKEQRDDAQNQRKELWREKGEIETRLKIEQDKALKHERTLETAWGRDAQKGLAAIHKLINSGKVNGKGVYGPLIELFEVEEKFVTAVEVVGGGSLAHVVVDNEQTAAKLVKELTRQNLGRVTFMPLAQLASKGVVEENPGPSSDVIPLISRLKFDAMYTPAFKQVFGKTLIARNEKTAAEYSRMHRVNCVTLDGDQVNKRGAITGGFTDSNKSRITAMKKVKDAMKETEKLSAELKEHEEKATACDSNVADILSRIQRGKQDMRAMKQQQSEKKEQLDRDKQTLGFDAGDLLAKRELIASVQKNIRSLTKDRDVMQAEVGTDLVSKLSKTEQKELQDLIKRATVLGKQLPACRQKRAELEASKTQLTSRLNEHLKKREDELSDQLAAVGTESSSASQGDSQGDDEADISELALERLRSELKQTTDEEKKLRKEEKELEESRTKTTKDLAAFRKQLDKSKREENAEELAKVEAQMEELQTTRATLTSKKETAMKKIRELGSLPADAFEKYTETANAGLLKKLKKVNEKLGKLQHVNKKALDQYMSFTQQRDELQNRMEELDGAKVAIEKLIKVLDQRKDDAIQRTFKGVSQHFTEIFKEIVPHGKATLVMLKKRAREDEEDDEDEDEDDEEDSEEDSDDDGESAKKKRKGAKAKKKKKKKKKATKKKGKDDEPQGVLAYGGVSIKVSFTGKGEVYYLNQLSGGQKSVVALAFIFAIQRLDPAPYVTALAPLRFKARSSELGWLGAQVLSV